MKKEIHIKKEITSVIGKGGNTFRVTIPKEISDLLELKEKDKFIWKYELKNGELQLDMDIEKQ